MKNKIKEQEIALKIKTYQDALSKFGDDPKALLWKSTEAAEMRYRELVADLDCEGKSILDVGCGFGDIIPHISEKTSRFSYTGIDMVPESIEIAKNKYPNHGFIVGDYINTPMQDKFDIILCCGALNSNFDQVYKFRKEAIKIMYEHSNKVLAFNMAGSHPQPTNDPNSRIFYADSLKILKYCFTISNKVILRHHYHPKDFTIYMFKETRQ